MNAPLSFDLNIIQQVYSGKPGCACGCNGNYRAPSRHADDGVAIRGYAFSPDDISDRSVKLIANKVAKIANGDLPGQIDMMSPDWVSANNADGSRTYTVYFDSPQPAFVAAYGHLAAKVYDK